MYEAVGAVSFMRMFYDQSETWAWDAFHVPGWAYNKKSPGAIIVVPYLEHLEQYCESQEVAMKRLEDQLAPGRPVEPAEESPADFEEVREVEIVTPASRSGGWLCKCAELCATIFRKDWKAAINLANQYYNGPKSPNSTPATRRFQVEVDRHC